MRHKLLLCVLCLVAAMCFVTPQLQADTLTLTLAGSNCIPAPCNGYQFTTSVTQTGANTFNVSFEIQNKGGQPAYLQGFGLTLFGSKIDAAFNGSEPPQAWNMQVVDNSKYNNGDPTKNNCNSNGKGLAGSFCLDINNAYQTGYLLGNGGKIAFNLTVNGVGGPPVVLPSWHIMTNGTTVPDGGGNVFALSDDGVPTSTPQVPEPASLLLFGSGGLAIVRALRSKIYRKQ